MNSMNVFSLKVFGLPAFSAGTVFMYEEVDGLLGISDLVRKSEIKVKGVPLELLVKALVVGVLNEMKSVKMIYEDIKVNGSAKYIGDELDSASMRNLFRGIEKLGSKKGKKLYSQIVEVFQEKLGFDFSQINPDFTSSFFLGKKCDLAKHGYSRDHRPDKPQIKIGLVQCGKQSIPFQYHVDEGNKTDLEQFEPVFSSFKEKIPKHSLIVFDKGVNSLHNRKLVRKAKHHYLTSVKMTSKTKNKIKSIEQKAMKKVSTDTKCSVEKTSEGYQYYFFSEKLAKQTMERRKRRIARQIEKAKELQEKVHGKRFKKNKLKKKLKVAELTEETIITEVKIQKRLITKPLNQIRKELEDNGKDFDGWFVLASSKKLSEKNALKKYRNKDSVEKLFCTLKQNCKLRPFNVRKKQCVKGSIFISMLSAFVLGCFQWTNKSLRNKSHKSILETIKHLTLALKINKFGKITEAIAMNVNDFLKKLFPCLQT